VKIARAMNLDTSERYFRTDGDLLVMHLPEACNSSVVNDISTYLKAKVSDAVDSGISKAIFDLQEVKRLDMTLIKLLLTAMQSCREVALTYTMVGGGEIIADCKGYEDTRNWQFHENIESARQSFQKVQAVA